MKALILAAGRGRRQKNNFHPKPLISLLGLSLIERVILTAKKSSINEFQIVIGYNGESIRTYLGNGSKYGVEISYIFNDEWKRGNGISVLKAKNYIQEPFIILMADHIFDESILSQLQKVVIEENKCILCVDRSYHKYLDLEDATKVIVEDEKIKDIGKNLKKYNGIDTGIFLCTPVIFDALEKSINNRDDSLSGGIKVLANQNKMKALDISDKYWIDIDDHKALRNAKKLLYDMSIKPANGFISRHINRRFSTRIFTPLLFKMNRGITPNQVSILSFIVSIISSVYFFLGHTVVGALLIQLSSILDGCDGEIARLKFIQSSFGNFIDAVLDRYADSFILLGIFYYLLIEMGNKEIFGINLSPLIICCISVLAILGNLMVSYTSAKSVVNFCYRYKGKFIAAGRGRDLRLFLLFIGGIMTYFHPIYLVFTLIIIALQTNIIVIWRVFLSWNYFQKMNLS